MLSEVFKDIEIEPKLTLLTGEELDNRTVNTTNEARLDIRARGVWERGQQAFSDFLGFLIPRLAAVSARSCNIVM